MVFWNIIIKAFQTGFLTYALEAIKGINRYIYAIKFGTKNTNEQPNVPDYSISITILIVLIVFIIFNFTFTLFSSPDKFCQKEAKARYGAIYSGLDVWRFSALF